MKKIISLFLMISVILSLFGCGEYNPIEEPVDNNTNETPKEEEGTFVNSCVNQQINQQRV